MSVRKAVHHGMILLLLTGLGHACQAQSNAPSRPASDPALDGDLQAITVGMSKAGLHRKPSLLIMYDEIWREITYRDVAINSCSLSFTIESTNKSKLRGTLDKDAFLVQVPLGQLSDVSIASTPEDQGQHRNTMISAISLKSSDPVITVTNRNTPDRKREVRIYVRDSDAAQSLAKAFHKAIDGCGTIAEQAPKPLLSQSNAKPQANNCITYGNHCYSKEEILDLIKKDLPKTSVHRTSGADGIFAMSYSDVTVEDCFLTYTSKSSGNMHNLNPKDIDDELDSIKMPLGKLAAASVKSSDEWSQGDERVVQLDSLDDVISESWKKIEHEGGNNEKTTTGSQNSSTAKIYSSDRKWADGLSMEFNLAMKLCSDAKP